MADFNECAPSLKSVGKSNKGKEKEKGKVKDNEREKDKEALEVSVSKCEGAGEDSNESNLIDFNKPIDMIYCAVCTMPPEFCEFGASFDLCLPWITNNCPQYLSANAKKIAKKAEAAKVAAVQDAGVDAVSDAVGNLAMDDNLIGKVPATDDEPADEDEAKTRKKKGGGAAPLRKAAVVETKVVVTRVQRQKRKYVTVVGGLDTVPDLKIKDAARVFGKKFSSGASVSESPQGAKEIVIQGDVWFDLPQLLISEFKVAPTAIFYLEEGTLRPYA